MVLLFIVGVALVLYLVIKATSYVVDGPKERKK